MEDLLEPDGLCSVTSSTESKNTGLASPRPALGKGERLVHPFPFLALPRHVREEPSQKKSDLQWLLDRLGLEQCGNYGWQEGRCVVERSGGCRAESSYAKDFKRATKELEEK